MSLIVIAISIQDMWLIEEKAISLRNFKIFNPPRAPIIEEKMAETVIKKIRLEENARYEIRNIGANFWIVKRIRAWGQVRPSITWGNQKCNGAAPNFKSKDKAIRMYEKSFEYIWIDLDMIKIVDARAWIRKYLIAASVE